MELTLKGLYSGMSKEEAIKWYEKHLKDMDEKLDYLIINTPGATYWIKEYWKKDLTEYKKFIKIKLEKLKREK